MNLLVSGIARFRGPASVGVVVALLAACAGDPAPLAPHQGERLYTQVGMWVDGDEHIATNYRRGWHVPINTRVEIVESSDETIVVRVPELERRFTIINEPAYTREDIVGLYQRYFGPSPVDLSGFPAEACQAIENGRLRRGLSKEAVLLARGYPPVHRTASTRSNTWYYWVSRLDKRRIEFEDGAVARIED